MAPLFFSKGALGAMVSMFPPFIFLSPPNKSAIKNSLLITKASAGFLSYQGIEW
jgi:hypothetical protein